MEYLRNRTILTILTCTTVIRLFRVMEEIFTTPVKRNKTSRMCSTFHNFSDLRLQGALCDVVLVADGVKFKAHKLILCGCSPYFRALFTGGWNVMGKQEYDIPGVSPEAMRLIIEYAYTFSFDIVSFENVETLLVAADQLNILDLMQFCSKFLEDQLCLENCAGIYIIADLYNRHELRQSALCFILENFKEIASTSEEFLELPLRQLCDIIEKDDLNVRREEVVFDAIIRWILHEPASRKAHISVLLPKVRMGRMDKEFFMNHVQNHDVVKASEECRSIISSVIKCMFDLDISVQAYPLIRPRRPSEILLAIDGIKGIEAYDSRVDCWVDVTQQVEGPWAHHGAVYLEGSVYCIGTYRVHYTECSAALFRDLCCSHMPMFNPIGRPWSRLATPHKESCFASVTVLNGFIYSMGGSNGKICLKTAQRYHPESNKWSFIRSMYARRSKASATALHGKVYICGGVNETEFLSTCECYDPATDRWTMIPPMRTPRSGLGVVAYHGKIYAVGGTNRSEVLRSVEAYDPQTNRWDVVAPMLNYRSNFGIEVLDDLIFVVGGKDQFGTTTKVEYFDAETGSWYAAQDMGFSRCNLSCCIVPALPGIIDYATSR